MSRAVQAAGAQRPPDYRRQRPKYPQLGDADWLTARLAAGGTVRSIARELGADRHTVRSALARHGLDRLPGQLAERFRQAVEFEAEARLRQANIVAQLRRRGDSVADIAELLNVTRAAVRRLSKQG